MRYESRRRNYLLLAEHVRASPGVRLLTIECAFGAPCVDSSLRLADGRGGLILNFGAKHSRALMVPVPISRGLPAARKMGTGTISDAMAAGIKRIVNNVPSEEHPVSDRR